MKTEIMGRPGGRPSSVEFLSRIMADGDKQPPRGNVIGLTFRLEELEGLPKRAQAVKAIGARHAVIVGRVRVYDVSEGGGVGPTFDTAVCYDDDDIKAMVRVALDEDARLVNAGDVMRNFENGNYYLFPNGYVLAEATYDDGEECVVCPGSHFTSRDIAAAAKWLRGDNRLD